MKNCKMPWLIGLALLSLLPLRVAASPLDEIVEKASDRWPADRYEVFSSANDCVEAKTGLSLPFAQKVVGWARESFKGRGYRVAERFSPGRETLVIKCRWDKTEKEIDVTFQLIPWEKKHFGSAEWVSSKIATSSLEVGLFTSDLASWARTMVHRLEQDKNLLPQKIHVRPFGAEDGVINAMVEAFFAQWLHDPLRQSSVFIPVELAGVSVNELRGRVRPEQNELVSLTGSLLQADSELTFRIHVAPAAANNNRSVVAINKINLLPSGSADHSEVVIGTRLMDRQGKKLTESEIKISADQLPQKVRLALTNASDHPTAAAQGSPAMKLELTTTKGEGLVHYRNGELMQFLIRTDQPAYIHLFNIDSASKVALLYPAFGSRQEALPERKLFIVPDDALPYELKVQPPFGQEIIWAIATSTPITIPDPLTGELAEGATVKQAVREIAKKSGGAFADQDVLVQTGPVE
ncbi:MAG: hypothetical protein HW380_3608 [Magnetococcales bacterium]|nr:hypothetical protein [Magnetococcales bacterium]HIJ83275.1 DUF4384 domain-containing protein [Magnetococcales bacterium]